MTSRGEEDEVLWAAVGEPSRRRLLDLLVARGEATATALSEDLPFSRQAVAKHLAVLEQAGLVERRPSGREVRYVVAADRLDAATRALARVAARWDSRLAAIKSIAEAAARAEGAGGTATPGDAATTAEAGASTRPDGRAPAKAAEGDRSAGS